MSALLAKTVRSSTLKHALIWIGIFGALVLGLFGYVYWATASYVRSRSDGAVAAERRILEEAYDRAGRVGLVSAIEQRIAEQRFDGLYLLADPAFASVAGNLKSWPLAPDRPKGWDSFTAPRDGADHALWRAKFDTLPDGYHLLVARQIDDLDEFARDIRSALLWCILLIFALAAMASITVTRRTVGRIETINATTRPRLIDDPTISTVGPGVTNARSDPARLAARARPSRVPVGCGRRPDCRWRPRRSPPPPPATRSAPSPRPATCTARRRRRWCRG